MRVKKVFIYLLMYLRLVVIVWKSLLVSIQQLVLEHLYTPQRQTLKLGELSDSFLSETNDKNEEKTVLTKAT